jgi:tetratricopeptide (TPR) repeat protein
MGQKTVEQPVQNKIVQVHRPKRNRRQQEAIKQINEYAFWCIENNMWTEARLHLEQGLQQDSLSASIHNNLGIVYERLGLQEKAAAAYVKARSLNQKKQAYQINLQLFDRRQQAGRIDSVEAQTKAVEDLSDPFASDGNRTHPPERTGE